MSFEPSDKFLSRLCAVMLTGQTQEEMQRQIFNQVRDYVLHGAARIAISSLRGPPHTEWDQACCAIAQRLCHRGDQP